MGYKDGEGPRGDDVRGAAEVTGPVQPGREEAEGRPHRSLQLLSRGSGGAGADLFSLVTSDRT